MTRELSHCCSARIAVGADAAFAFLCDGAALGRWALGCWDTEFREDGLLRGASLFDGSQTWVRLSPDNERLLVDYHLGAGPDDLRPRISARVVPGEVLGDDPGHCVATLTAWRPEAMDDERWGRLKASHAVEILLIKALLERDDVDR